MKHIIQKFDVIVYGYNPMEFMPIRVDGELSNRAQFIAYKTRCIMQGRFL